MFALWGQQVFVMSIEVVLLLPIIRVNGSSKHSLYRWRVDFVT